MTSLLTAVGRLREATSWPLRGTLSARELLARNAPAQRGSIRSYLDDSRARWSTPVPFKVLLCRFKNEPIDVAWEKEIEDFWRSLFARNTSIGLVGYFDDNTFGAVDVSGSEVFGWFTTTRERKDAGGKPDFTPPGPGRATLTEEAIAAAKADGTYWDRIAGHQIISVYQHTFIDDSGKYADDDWAHILDGSHSSSGINFPMPNVANAIPHEMGHSLGMEHDRGPIWGTNPPVIDDYWDVACLMSQQGSFQTDDVRMGISWGPALCSVHLRQKGWMLTDRVVHITAERIAARGRATFTISPLTALASPHPLTATVTIPTPDGARDCFIDVIAPQGWNRGVLDAPLVAMRRIESVPAYPERATYLAAAVFAPRGVTPAIGATATATSDGVTIDCELVDLRWPSVQITVSI